MSRAVQRIVIVALAALTGVGIASGLTAEGTKAIEARHEAMESIGDAMKALGAIARGKTAFDADVVREQATTIAEELKKASTLFPPGSDKGDAETFAKPEVWTDAEGFAEAMKSGETAAAALRAVTKETDFRPALGELGGTCKSCHQRFRLPMP